MIYFSYNDYIDYVEKEKIDKIIKVEEKISKYEVKDKTESPKNKIIDILKEKKELKKFLKDFFNLNEIINLENINQYNSIKTISDKETKNNIIFKIKEKEIFIFIKVIENIDNNIAYKMFEHSLNIIKKWNVDEKCKNKRYPIVIPIVIYIGEKLWKSNNKVYKNVNYITFKDNEINFSYNLLNINDLEIEKLKNMKSKISEELINTKYKYLQIN